MRLKYVCWLKGKKMKSLWNSKEMTALRPCFHSAGQSNKKITLHFLVAGIFALAKANVIQIVCIVITLEKQNNAADILLASCIAGFCSVSNFPSKY